jgi:hypothetical protein
VVKDMPAGIKVECPTQTEINIKGADRQVVGQMAAEVRAVRPPEPYKGKGIRYSDERVVSKRPRRSKERAMSLTRKNSVCAARARPACASPSRTGRAPDGVPQQPAHLCQRDLRRRCPVLASASTAEKEVREQLGAEGKGGNVAAAAMIGKRIAEKAKAAGVEKVAFDRSGFCLPRPRQGPGRGRPRSRSQF